MKTTSGFSLIELMVAVAVLAILAGIAAPSFVSMIAQSQLDAQTSSIVSAVQFARAQAVKLNTPARLCRAASATALACANGDGNDNWTDWIILRSDNSDILHRGSISGAGGAMQARSNLTNNTLDFGGDGLARNTGTITVCTTRTDSNNRRKVTIGVAGRTAIDAETGACP